MVLNIGITGHRPNRLVNIPVTEVYGLAKPIFRDLVKLARDNNIRLRMYSALAEGVDRLLVDFDRLGVEGAIELHPVLPFGRAEYQKDFMPGTSLENPQEGTVEAFNNLLSAAGYGSPRSRIVELPLKGMDEEDRAAGYARAGEFIISHSDLMLAVFDGNTDQELKGGTLDTIKKALAVSVPVICIMPLPDGELSAVLMRNPELELENGKLKTDAYERYSSAGLARLLNRE